MIEKAIAAVEDAAAAAARGGMTRGLQQYASSLGWDPTSARSLRVAYEEGSFTVNTTLDRALDEEYGDASGSRPKPAIRTFDSKGLSKAHLYEALNVGLGGVL